jgi:ADP-ribose pyrophosphatase YjhB (NUDIX family)
MNFCSHCGSPVQLKIPPADNRPRFVCDQCGAIYYSNPKIVAGCLAEWEDKILLCKRAIEPRYGLWTLPAGFMENDETTIEAALRETWEEARARVEVHGLYALFNLPHVNQVYMMFRGRLLDLDFGPGEESLEVDLFEEGQIPWDKIAFQTIHHTLRFYLKDRRAGEFRFHMGDIIRLVDGPHLVERRAELVNPTLAKTTEASER